MKKITTQVVELLVKLTVFVNITYFGTQLILNLINTTGGSTSSQNLGFILLLLLPSVPVILAFLAVRSFRVKVKIKSPSTEVVSEVVVKTKANFISAD